MSAYMIVFAKIHDRDAFLRGYAPAASQLVTKFGGKYLLRAQDAEVLEGPLKTGMSVVISEWPDRETIKRFWNSREYARAKALRKDIADVDVIIADQLPPGISGEE